MLSEPAGTPPPQHLVAYFDKQWNGKPHQNRCYFMRGGKIVVKFTDIQQFIVYGSETVPTLTTTDFENKALVIESASKAKPHANANVCLGISQSTWR